MAQIFKAKKKSVSQKMLTLNVTAMDHQGRGVAKQGNKVCFVNGALPGEEVKALLIEDKARFASADCKKALSASAHRVTPFVSIIRFVVVVSYSTLMQSNNWLRSKLR